jgi:hypothetical protein
MTMSVWLWDAVSSTGSAGGVTDNEARAQLSAEEGMLAAGAATATVELATHLDGGGWMQSCYRRTGRGWMARRRGDHVTWEPLPRLERAS